MGTLRHCSRWAGWLVSPTAAAPPAPPQFAATHPPTHLPSVSHPHPPPATGSIRNLNILKILVAEGYHITFVPTASGRDPHYTARVRFLGVDVQTPVTTPDKWQFVHRGRCMYDVIFVARRAVHQLVGGARRGGAGAGVWG